MFEVLFETVQDGEELYLTWLLNGLAWTVALALAGWCFAFVLGVLVGCCRTSSNRGIALAARLYVEVFRNIPIIVQMFLWYFVLPELLPADLGSAMKKMPPPGVRSFRPSSRFRSTPERAWPSKSKRVSRRCPTASVQQPGHSA